MILIMVKDATVNTAALHADSSSAKAKVQSLMTAFYFSSLQ